MNKVIIVNLNGTAFQLEEDGYNALRAYLEGAAQRLSNNPDRGEIIADIEQAIADKFRGVTSKFKNVVETKEVAAVIAEMGPVNDDSDEAESASATSNASATDQNKTRSTNMNTANPSDIPSDSNGPARRLYKIPEGAMVAGVCNGVAAYFGIDAIMVRLGFFAISLVIALVGLMVHWFILLPFLAYAVLALTLPAANTAAERAAARGDPSTAQEYIRRAKQGYYEGLKNFAAATNEKPWKKWKYEMRSQAYQSQHYSQPNWAHGFAPGLVLPILAIAQIAVFIVWSFGLMSLVTHHSAFGIGLPADVPLWIGLLVMFFALHLVLWPLRAMKFGYHASLHGYSPYGYRGTFIDSLVSIAALVAAVWFADHYIPAFHEFLLTLPARIDSAAQAISNWWSSHR